VLRARNAIIAGEKMIPSTIMWKGREWNLHSYVYGRAKATKIAESLKRFCGQRAFTRVVKVEPNPGTKESQYAIYWRYKDYSYTRRKS